MTTNHTEFVTTNKWERYMCVRKPLNKENKEGLMGEESISTANVKACFLSVRVLHAHVHAAASDSL